MLKSNHLKLYQFQVKLIMYVLGVNLTDQMLLQGPFAERGLNFAEPGAKSQVILLEVKLPYNHCHTYQKDAMISFLDISVLSIKDVCPIYRTWLSRPTSWWRLSRGSSQTPTPPTSRTGRSLN